MNEQALQANKIRSPQVEECKSALIQRSRNSKVTLVWVHSQKGYAGNEKAYEVSRLGADSPFTGPELVILPVLSRFAIGAIQ